MQGNAVDDWYASFEWGAGGIVHVHLVLWVHGAPRLDAVLRPDHKTGNLPRYDLGEVAEDATVYFFDVRDKEGRSAKRDKEMMAFAEEILVTKSDLEQKTSLMAELTEKVNELTLHNEYQLRLKDMNYNEKIKEVTEKFTQELDSDKKNYELLLQDKIDMD